MAQGRVAKLVLIGAVPPIMVKSAANPGGTPIEVFDGFRSALAANRSQFYLDVASGPFYGYNRPGVPALVMHGDDDQVVPIADSALLSAKLLRNATLKVYKGLPHGMCATHADAINADLLAFVKS